MSLSLSLSLSIVYCIVSLYAATVAALKYNRRHVRAEKAAIWLVFLLFWVPILLFRDLDKSIKNFFIGRDE